MSLEEKRGYKQPAFTRLRSSLSRYIALSDIPNVKLYTDKLKFAFAAYEAAHEVVLESVNIEENQATYDKEGEQFVQTEELFVQSLHSAGACINASSTSATDTISQLMSVPRVEIQSFDGAAASYMTFVAVFDEVVGNVNISGQAKLTRLLQFTTGTARDAIDCCALIGGDQGYDEARRILRERFGDPYIITTALIDKLKQQKEARTPSALRTLADELNSAKIVLKSLNMYSELDNQHHIKEVGARLSSHLWYAWRDRVFNIKRKNKRYATFDEFVEFVTEKADEANDPVYGQKSSSASFSEKSRPSPTPKRATALNNVGSSDFKRKSCDVCQEQHPVWRCDTFKKLTIDKRKEAVVKHKLCINCLMSGHNVINCVKQAFCRVSDCTAKHNKLLHETVVANHKIDTTVCNVCMPVVPALAGGKDIFCLLDTGSTSTFVSKKLATKLNLDVTVTNLNLRTLNSSVSKTVDSVNVTIESVDRNFSIDMRSIYVVDSIPTKSYTIDVKAYSHLRDIDFVSTFDHEVDLLIGQDYASCFVPLEIRKGLKNEPYAVRTPLGYVVNGGNGGYHNSAISHLISTTTIERDISKLWELDQYDTSPTCGYTQDERRVIDLWDDQSVLVDKHWVIPIPWNDKVPDLHNNYHQAKARLQSLKKSLHKRDKFQEYDLTVKNLITDGYAEVAPDSHGRNPLFYLPHHDVPKKNGSMRLVFDCACKFRGVSLNDVVHQGPDLINKLNYVLLRFRQHQYAMTADITAMYNQVRVPQDDRDALRFLWFEGDDILQLRMTSHLFGGVWCACVSSYALQKAVADEHCATDVQCAVLKSFYVDDLLYSFDDKEGGARVINAIDTVMRDNGFQLSKFNANDGSLLSNLSMSHVPNDEIVNISDSKVLGVMWNTHDDYFYFNVCITDMSVVTRRSILSFVCSIFDPLGLISPIILCGRVIFQLTTRLKLAWDTPVPDPIRVKWLKWLNTLQELQYVKVP